MLKGLGNLGNIGGILKQAMQVKERMEALKEKLTDERIEAAAGGGMVKLTLNGRMEVLEIKIDPEIIDKNEPEVLETLVRAAVNEGIRNTRALVEGKMKELAGGIDIPGLT